MLTGPDWPIQSDGGVVLSALHENRHFRAGRFLDQLSAAFLAVTGWGFLQPVSNLVTLAPIGANVPPLTGERSSSAPRHRNAQQTAAIAARLADLQQRSRDTDAAAAADLQQLLRQGQQLADAMAAVAEAMDSDTF
jgi:hypothetical protein